MAHRALLVTVLALAVPPAAAAQSHIALGPGPGASIAREGRVLAYTSGAARTERERAGGFEDVFIRRGTVVERILGADGRPFERPAHGAALSDDGRRLAFCSAAANATSRRRPGADALRPPMYLRDLRTGRTRLVARRSAGHREGTVWWLQCQPSVSRDGRYVAHLADGAGLVRPGEGARRRFVRLFDARTGRSVTIARSRRGEAEARQLFTAPAVDPDGRVVTFVSKDPLVAADRDASSDVYRYVIRTRRLQLVSRGDRFVGCAPVATASAGGRYTAFSCSRTADLSRPVRRYVLFLRDHARGRTRVLADSTPLVALAGDLTTPLIAADGSRVAFASDDRGLVAPEPDVYRKVYVVERATRRIRRVSVRPDGTPVPGPAELSDISASGRWISYTSPDTPGGMVLSGPW